MSSVQCPDSSYGIGAVVWSFSAKLHALQASGFRQVGGRYVTSCSCAELGFGRRGWLVKASVGKTRLPQLEEIRQTVVW